MYSILYLEISLRYYHWCWSINSKIIGKISSGDYLMSLIFDITPFVYLESCAVFLYPLLGNWGSTYATILFLYFLYSISGPHSLIMILHIKTISAWIVFKGNLSLSVLIFNRWPNIIVLNYFKVITMLSSSLSVTVYFFESHFLAILNGNRS